MKNFVKTFLAVMALGSGSVYAQKSSIDSPHNYKRPVFQQRKALTESNALQISSQSSYKIQNNLSSVHNYKRQGTSNFATESALVISKPIVEPTLLNPLISPNHYKANFQSTEFGKQFAIRNMRLKQKPLDEIAKDSTLTSIE
jgi:hypothetical protein